MNMRETNKDDIELIIKEHDIKMKQKKDFKKKKKKVDNIILPQKIIPIPNNDKDWHEKWYPSRDMLNFPHPYRCVLAGPPNSGKSTVIKNLLVHADPPFEEVIVVHCDPEYTKEYDDMEVTLIGEVPSPEEFEGELKTMVILDDLEYKQMCKDQKRCLDRLFGYVSTHKNISLCLTAQDPFNTPTCVRRNANLWVLWKIKDLDSLTCIGRKTGYRKKEFLNLFDAVCHDTFDSVWIDATNKSPYPLRKNGFQIINSKEIDC